MNVITVTAWYAYLHRRILQLEVAAILLVLAVATTFSTEFVREGIRKPYIIQPLLYSNGIQPMDVSEWEKQTIQKNSVLLVDRLYPGTKGEKTVGKWMLPDKANYHTITNVERGRYIFQSQCSSCHTLYGFNPLVHASRGWSDTEFAKGVLKNLHVSKPFMPPFIGSDRDKLDLASFAVSLAKK